MCVCILLDVLIGHENGKINKTLLLIAVSSSCCCCHILDVKMKYNISPGVLRIQCLFYPQASDLSFPSCLLNPCISSCAGALLQ